MISLGTQEPAVEIEDVNEHTQLENKIVECIIAVHEGHKPSSRYRAQWFEFMLEVGQHGVPLAVDAMRR